MKKINSSAKILPIFLAVLFFGVFLGIGLRIYDDYGPVSEEKNQIDAGHIIWAQITGDSSHFPELPALENYMNRYYGQGATFITVLLEAASGFRWDINRVWKVRRLWNFFCFFAAVICFFVLVRKRYRSWTLAFPAALNLILLPRMFPEVFYNDRDPLFLTWMIFTLCALLLFVGKTGFLTAFLFGVVLAFLVNIRLFGLVFLIPLVLIFLKYPAKRVWLIPVLLVFLLVWYGISPIMWGNPFAVLRTSIVHLTTRQRLIDTQGASQLLFAGKFYPEQSLPWFYLPLWVLISTPLVLLGLACFGMFLRFRNRSRTVEDEYSLIDFSLAVFMALFLIGIPVIRPTLYSGWRHFYFLNLSLVWFAVYGLNAVLKLKQRRIRYALLLTEGISLALTAFWMVTAHPYEGVYFNPVFRQAAADNFERDTGYISTLECLQYLAENAPDQKIEVMNANAYVPFAMIGLPQTVRERFSTIDWKMQRVPMKYVIFNYNNRQGNEMDFPYYAPVFHIERNGTKLAEVFERTNNGLLAPDQCVEEVHASVNDEQSARILSDEADEIWSGAGAGDTKESILIVLRDGVTLESLELFPGDHTGPSESLRFFTTGNPQTGWVESAAERYGTNGWKFSIPLSGYLRIQSSTVNEEPWQVRQILFYGRRE